MNSWRIHETATVRQMVSNGSTDDGVPWNRRRKEAFDRDGYECQYCDADEDEAVALWAHHTHQDSAGGSDTLENLVTLCERCHKALHAYGDGDVLEPRQLDRLDELPPRNPDLPHRLEMDIILEVMRDGKESGRPWGFATPKMVRDRLPSDSHQINRAFNQLMATGQVTRVNKGLYRFDGDQP